MNVLRNILEITNIDVYVQKPKYLLIPPILTMIFVLALTLIQETQSWTYYQWISIIIICLAFFIVAFGAGVKIKRWLWDERQYNKIIKNPFEMHFIIPPSSKYKIDYYKQDTIPIRVDEIPIPANSKRIIFLWVKPEIDIDIREQQFGFGGEGNKPKIIQYNNPYIRQSNTPHTWFIDWWDIYHIVDKEYKGKDEKIVHGFEIETYSQGKFVFDIRFNVSCDKYKNLEKTKTNVTRNKLKINVI